jgi:hypothetical protein
MSVKIRQGTSDATIESIREVLSDYNKEHPRAQIELYRQNPVSVRVRIIDPEFAQWGRPERNQRVWEYLSRLPEDMQSDISILLLLTPSEIKTSFANFEFEDPVPSQL